MSPFHAQGRSYGEGGSTDGTLLLAAWDRYARLLDEQIATLDTVGGAVPDLVRFTEIGRHRHLLADEIEALAATLRRTRGPGLGLPALRARMAACRSRDQALLARLAELRAGTVQALRTLDARRPGRDGYLARLGTASRSPGRRFDTRS